MSYSYVLENRGIQPIESVPFPADDIGFLNGYGCFETIRVTKGRVPFLDLHYQRLRNAAEYLAIPFSINKTDLRLTIEKLLKKNDAQEARLNLYLTPGDAGAGEPGYLLGVMRPFTIPFSTTTVSLKIYQESTLRSSVFRYKLMSRFSYVHPKLGLGPDQDLLIVDPKNQVLETSIASVIFVQDDMLIFPDIEAHYIVPGVGQTLLKRACTQAGFKVKMRTVTLSDLPHMSEIFLVNALRGIIRVSAIDSVPGLRSKTVTDQVMTCF